MRPIYETEKDLVNERSLSDVVSKKWKCTLQKLQPRDPFDYAAVRSKEVVAFVEMKNRTNSFGKYDTYMISMTKLVHARSINQATSLPCILAVRWTDLIGWVRLDNVTTQVTMGGRFDRNDPQDIEPVCHISMKDFIII